MKKKILLSIILIILAIFLAWFVWPIPKYSLKYTVSNGFANYEAEIEIYDDGTITYRLLSLFNDVPYSNSGKLSDGELTSLGNLVMKGCFFPALPTDLTSRSGYRTDQESEDIEVVWGQKKYISGGYDIRNQFFRIIVGVLEDYVNKYNLKK